MYSGNNTRGNRIAFGNGITAICFGSLTPHTITAAPAGVKVFRENGVITTATAGSSRGAHKVRPTPAAPHAYPPGPACNSCRLPSEGRCAYGHDRARPLP